MSISTTTTIRVSTETHRRLAALSETLDAPIADVTARAVALLEAEQIWVAADVAYAAIRADPQASADWDAEITVWDVALQDGLEHS